MHISTHRYMALAVLPHICTGSDSESSRRHLTRYAELLLESMLASLDTSVTAFLLPGQVTLQEARSGPKTATRYPVERAAHPRQWPASFTRPVTPQQCVGGFFYAMGEWNLSPAGSCWHLCGRWTGEGRGPAGEVEGVRVSSNKELRDCWTSLRRNKRFAHMTCPCQARATFSKSNTLWKAFCSLSPTLQRRGALTFCLTDCLTDWLTDWPPDWPPVNMWALTPSLVSLWGTSTPQARIIEGHYPRGHATAGTLWLILLPCGPSRLMPWASTHGKRLCRIPPFPSEPPENLPPCSPLFLWPSSSDLYALLHTTCLDLPVIPPMVI